MKEQEYQFFKQSVILICGNLNIEQALKESLVYFQDFMPAHRVFLQLYDQGLGVMRTIATATPDKGNVVDLITPLSREAQASVEEAAARNLPHIVILEDPGKYPIGREMLAYHKISASSLMIMGLTARDKPLGSLVLVSESGVPFTEEHKHLISLLKEPFSIAMANALQHREVIRLKDLLTDDNKFLNDQLYRKSGDTIVGANFGLKAVMDQVRQVAHQDTPVLLLGETGTGKDVIANAIHYTSRRRDGPFITVNCGAIPDTLIDSELFGHEKGAFTGALYQKRGRFERAHKGTIFLDEIGELPLHAQVRLLRVLQHREIERVGGTDRISLDIRIIAATHQDLKKRISKKEFREDLWFRLNVFPITIPPLRERKPDIPALVQHFITIKSRELKLPGIPGLAPHALDALLDYHWPGNVRELENIIERALILNTIPLTFDQLLHPPPHQPHTIVVKNGGSLTLDTIVRNHIRAVLETTGGKIHGPGGAAEVLGVNASTLRHKMKKLGIIYGRKKE